MASPTYYSIPPPPPQKTFKNYVVLPSDYFPSFHTFLLLAILFSVSIYVLWPSDPELKIVRLRLNHLNVHLRPRISVDVSVATTVRVRNRDAFTVDFDGIKVVLWYKGKKLGHVTSREGHVRAWGSSYVELVTELNGVHMMHDWVQLLEDLIKGQVLFTVSSTLNGRLHFYSLELPLQANISCEMHVDVKNQSITHQSCYPE